jgi:AcrR family transcriptional regulator
MVETQDGVESGETGARIRDAATRLIARQGFAAVSMRQIAAEVGVQVGTIYLYVDDKQALLSGLILGFLGTRNEARAARAVPEEAEDALRSFVWFHLDVAIADRDLSRIARFETRHLAPEPLAAAEALERAHRDALAEILVRGNEVGTFGITDIGVAVAAIVGMLDAGADHLAGGGIERGRLRRILWRLARRMVWGAGNAQNPSENHP